MVMGAASKMLMDNLPKNVHHAFGNQHLDEIDPEYREDSDVFAIHIGHTIKDYFKKINPVYQKLESVQIHGLSLSYQVKDQLMDKFNLSGKRITLMEIMKIIEENGLTIKIGSIQCSESPGWKNVRCKWVIFQVVRQEAAE